MSLMDLLQGQKILENWLDKDITAEGEVDASLDQLLQELEGRTEEKVESYCRLIRELELTSQARADESARIKALADRDANAAKSMKSRLLYYFGIQGIKRLETQTFRLSVCANGGLQPLEVSTLAENLPQEFQRVSISPNTENIRKALAAGQTIEGVTLLPRGEHLRIK